MRDRPPPRIRLATADELGEAIRIDDDASRLYAERGVVLALDGSHPFVVAEQARWQRSAEQARLFFALDGDRPIGFAALDVLDGEPYLDQLAVLRSSMRRGVGGALLHHAIAWARLRGEALWLTTYRHLPFNRPFYERHGFVVVPDAACSPGVLHHLEEQRRALPAPEQRVAMRRLLADPS